MSDKDFFFDDEEEKPAKKAGPVKGGTSKPSRPAGAKTSAGASSFFEQNVTMAIASLMAVCALLLGVIIGIIIPSGGNVATAPTATSPAAVGGQTNPGPLSEEQLNSGDLPQGHPDISGAATGSTEPTSK